MNFFISELGAKGLGLLRELLPLAERFGALVNPNNPTSEIWTRDVTAAASLVGAQTDVINAGDSREIGRAFTTLIQNRTDALLIAPDSVFFNRRIQLATLATRHAVPAIYPWREAVEIGGLISYGTNLPDVYRQLGVYTGRILKGAGPSDLPIIPFVFKPVARAPPNYIHANHSEMTGERGSQTVKIPAVAGQPMDADNNSVLTWVSHSLYATR